MELLVRHRECANPEFKLGLRRCLLHRCRQRHLKRQLDLPWLLIMPGLGGDPEHFHWLAEAPQ